MFCFQCEQTAKCTGCTGKMGVCGKKEDTAKLQDKLTGALIGLARSADGTNIKERNHWVWARQRFDDYSMLVFDLLASEKNDYFCFPIAFIQDEDGNVVFENTKDVQCDVLKSYHDGVHSDKDYPEDIRYVFENNGKKAVYQLAGKQVLETGGLKTAPFIMKLVCKKMGINHSYARYLANGTLTLTDGNTEVKRSAELIYEFMFPGDSYIGHM